LIIDRNHKWLPKILSSIRSGKSTLFVLGSLPFAGEHSLQRLIASDGFRI